MDKTGKRASPHRAKKSDASPSEKKLTPKPRQKKLTPQQRLKRKQERMRAWRKAHPEASKRWKEANRERYLKYLSEYWWGDRHQELLAMKRKWNREHKEERRLYRLAVKKRDQAKLKDKAKTKAKAKTQVAPRPRKKPASA